MNTLDKKYQELLQDILDNGRTKQTRNGEVLSVFSREIRHNMKEGFPLLTTKRIKFDAIVLELLWFLQGRTDLKYLVDNGCNIWNGDCYQAYLKEYKKYINEDGTPFTQEQFIEKIKTDDKFATEHGNLGPIYGKQWRQWSTMGKGQEMNGMFTIEENMKMNSIDQIKDIIETLKNDPDNRRMLVSAWNPGVLPDMTLPPCHFGFQLYTRELTLHERYNMLKKHHNFISVHYKEPKTMEYMDINNIPKRAISLKKVLWKQLD